LRLSWEIARRGYRRYAAYPAATFAGVWTNTIFGFMQTSILLALFEQRSDVAGYDASDAVAYVWFAQAMLITAYAFGWYELALRIRSGDVVTDLVRPLRFRRDDVSAAELASEVGRRARLVDLAVEEPEIEEVVRRIYAAGAG
jgi:ABC-2 type transport system permease protein